MPKKSILITKNDDKAKAIRMMSFEMINKLGIDSTIPNQIKQREMIHG